MVWINGYGYLPLKTARSSWRDMSEALDVSDDGTVVTVALEEPILAGPIELQVNGTDLAGNGFMTSTGGNVAEREEGGANLEAPLVLVIAIVILAGLIVRRMRARKERGA